MDQKIINLLSTKEYCLVLSKKTNRVYIDKDMACYLFELIADGDSFCNKIDDAKLDKSKILKQKTFCVDFYCLGIKKIKIKPANGKVIEVTLSESDVPAQWRNEYVNGQLLRLKQTGQAQYLRNLSDQSFIVPTFIDKRNKCCYPGIHYGIAKTKNNESYSVLFSTLQEFSEWNEKKQKNKWVPLFLPLKKIAALKKDVSIIINPISDKIILNGQQIKTAVKGNKK